MSAYSDWKCGALSDADYRSACAQENAEERAYLDNLYLDVEEDELAFVGEGPIIFLVSEILPDDRQFENCDTDISTHDVRGSKCNTRCSWDTSADEMFEISSKLRKDGYQVMFKFDV